MTSSHFDAMPRRPDSLAQRRRGGFTLVELLVVMGIIALLISLLVPTLARSVATARRTRVAAELAGIATALDAYKQDFGDYPRFVVGSVDPLNTSNERGARIVCRALIGPAPDNDPTINQAVTPTTTGAYFATSSMGFQDGFGDAGNPFGFKPDREVISRGTQSAVTFPGKSYSPYLDPSRFKVRQNTTWSTGYNYGPDAVILDSQYSQPILYYPARVNQPSVQTNIGTVNGSPGGFYIAAWASNVSPQSLYNASDNIGLLGDIDPRTGLEEEHGNRFFFRELMGDLDQNGFIDSFKVDDNSGAVTSSTPGPNATPEEAVIKPFLLIAAGDNGDYYTRPVTNFTTEVPKQFPNSKVP